MFLVAPPFMRVKTLANTGWVNPGTGAAVALTGSSYNWNSTDNIKTENGTESVLSAALVNDSQFSRWIVATNFGFSLPTGAEILGIKARYKCRAQSSSVFYEAKDHLLQLFLAGAPIGTDQKSASNWASGTTTTLTFENRGGEANLWGATLTKADIETSTFGFGLAARNVTGALSRPRVDVMQLDVYYQY